MAYTIAAILLVLWAIGVFANFTLGGFIYVLLAVAVIMTLLRLVRIESPNN
jgi:hypothetical protein